MHNRIYSQNERKNVLVKFYKVSDSKKGIGLGKFSETNKNQVTLCLYKISQVNYYAQNATGYKPTIILNE